MTDRWLEIAVRMDPSDVDDVRITLSRWVGSTLAVEDSRDGASEPVVVRAYVPDGPECMLTRHAIEQALWHLGATGAASLREPEVRWIQPNDYLNQWREFYQPLPIGRRFIVVPSWLDAPETERQIIRLDPGMAFGTGLHPTTQLAVEAVERTVQTGATVIDVGTGSGILAIVAACRGALQVLAIDTDADAVRTASGNISANGCDDRVVVADGSLPIDGFDPADVLVANIVADVHLRCLHAYAKTVRSGGTAILGGVTMARAAEVRDAAQDRGFDIASESQRDDWACLTFTASVTAPVAAA